MNATPIQRITLAAERLSLDCRLNVLLMLAAKPSGTSCCRMASIMARDCRDTIDCTDEEWSAAAGFGLCNRRFDFTREEFTQMAIAIAALHIFEIPDPRRRS